LQTAGSSDTLQMKKSDIVMGNPVFLWPNQALAATADTETVDDSGIVRCVSVPKVVPFLPPVNKAKGTAILVCPGGGYRLLDWTAHVERLAAHFTPKGIAVIGLRYRTTPPSNSTPADAVADLRRAVRVVYANSEEWNLDPDRVVGLGFSAGANLLLHYACDDDVSPNEDELRRGEARLGYLAFLCLWPYNKSADAYNIRPDAPSVFLCATEEDETAPVAFSQAIGDAMKRAGGDVELRVYAKGNHLAFNFREEGPEIDWTPVFLAWLKGKGLF
jgi:acetyl esterase/lipase